jgi:hypothetical protein
LNGILRVLRILLFLFCAFGALFSGMFDNAATGILYAAATILALVGIFKPWASAAALCCIAIAALTSWGGGNPGH